MTVVFGNEQIVKRSHELGSGLANTHEVGVRSCNNTYLTEISIRIDAKLYILPF